MKKLNCALVGFGGIGHHHASRYAHCRNVRLVAICDIDPARLAAAESETNLGGSGALDLSKIRRYGISTRRPGSSPTRRGSVSPGA